MRNRYLFALATIFAGTMLACGSEAEESGASQPSSDRDLEFGGLCVPSNGLGTRDYQAPTTECTNAYGGHAQVVGALVDVGLAKVAVDLTNTGELPSSGGVKTATLLQLSALSGGIIGNTASAVVVGMNDETAAESEVQGLQIKLGVIDIGADVVKSRSEASCGSRVGGSIIANLRINGLVVAVSGQPNEHIVSGLVKVTINEQITSATRIRTNALHVSVLGLADIVVAQSEAALSCGCGASEGSTSGDPSGGDPNGAGTGPSGSGPVGSGPSGSDPNGSGPSGSDNGYGPSGSDPNGYGPSGGDATGAGPSGAPSSDPQHGSQEGDLWGGGLGAKCETNDACADGYYCAGSKRPTIK